MARLAPISGPVVVAYGTNLAAFDRWLSGAILRQLPFVYAAANTRLAVMAQQRVRGQLPFRFAIRNSWVSKGIQVIPARKTQAVPQAILGVRDDFMERQEEGGRKSPLRGRHLAIPTDRARTGRHSVVRGKNRPRALLSRPGHFIAPLSTRGAHVSELSIAKRGRRARRNAREKADLPSGLGIWRRRGAPVLAGKGRYAGKMRQPIELLYVLIRDAEVKERFGFEETAVESVERNHEKVFFELLSRAAEAGPRR